MSRSMLTPQERREKEHVDSVVRALDDIRQELNGLKSLVSNIEHAVNAISEQRSRRALLGNPADD
jgi:hypothetical protein